MRQISYTGITRGCLVVGMALTPLVVPTASHAGEQPVQLSANPVDQPGSHFSLVLRPGEHHQLKVALGNHGPTAIAGRTYASDVYTIINGGFGARLRGAPRSGTTTWLDYDTSILRLPPDGGVVRTFALTVPKGTAPGEYITSVVVENDKPVKGSGGVALDQVVRQAVAVVVRVPGPLRPALAIGTAQHTVVTGRSVLGVHVSNTGNARLTPRGELILRDGSGQQVSRTPVVMDSFYAHTETLVEVTLAKALLPGRYTVNLSLEDHERGGSAGARDLPLIVTKPAAAPGAAGRGSQLTEVLQSEPGGVSMYAIAGAAALVLGATAVLLLRRRRRTLRRPGQPS